MYRVRATPALCRSLGRRRPAAGVHVEPAAYGAPLGGDLVSAAWAVRLAGGGLPVGFARQAGPVQVGFREAASSSAAGGC